MKFLVDRATGAAIRAWARERLTPDPHGTGPKGDEYRTSSIYLDTEALDVFRRRGSFGRSKYRIRRYGQADVVFLERKMRTSRMLVKRRTAVALDALDTIDNLDACAGHPGDWFARRLAARALRAVCQVTYRRTARVMTTSLGSARLTLDDDLRAQPVRDVAFSDGPELPVLEGLTVVEFKFRHIMPATFKELVERFTLSPAPVSKYRLAAAALNLAWDRDRETALSSV